MRLSICIPTYNRAQFLAPLFDSIVDQTGYSCEIEVVVSDNASTDDTPELIEQYRDRLPNLVYRRAPENMGADRNFLKAVELASGQYCWLMGSDDRLEPDGIRHIADMLAENPSLAGLSVRNRSYNLEMDALIPSPTPEGVLPETTVIAGAESIFNTLGSYIGFLSGNVVDRQLWNRIVASDDVSPYFNGWIHAYVIGRMVQERPRWAYVAQPCVGWRSGNDSFLSEGMYRRLEIDIAGYSQVVAGLFGKNSRVYSNMMRSGLPHARHRVLHAKVAGAEPYFFPRARALLIRHYGHSPRFWLSCYPVFLLPSPLAALARAARRRLTSAQREV